MSRRTQHFSFICKTALTMSLLAGLALTSACQKSDDDGRVSGPLEKPESPENEKNRVCLAERGETDGPSIIGGKRLTKNGPIGRSTVRLLLHVRPSAGVSCTGTLIGSNMVLTAAHCFPTDMLPADKHASRTTVTFGNDPFIGCRPETRRVEQIIVHPGFNVENVGDANDLALVRFEGVAPSWTQPMPVATVFPETLVSGDIFLAGFGRTKDLSEAQRGDFPLKIGTVRAFGEVHTLAPLHQQLIGPLGDYNHTTSKFLAFNHGSGDGSVCSGDSGGPALVKENGILKVAGVASFVIFPNNEDRTCQVGSVHNSVSYYRQWLDENYRALMTATSTANPFELPVQVSQAQ